LRNLILVLLAVFLFAEQGPCEEKGPLKPGPKDKCPVCGMFVAKYPDWVAQVLFKDGTSVFFDGAKDFFKYYLDFKRYEPKRDRSEIQAMYVTEYYSLEPIEARQAFYVTGSDVYGPMGKELIPLARESDARQFMKDHGGKRLLRFDEVTAKLVKELD